MIHDTTFVIVDTETTGATAAQDKIVEIGAVKIRGGKIIGKYQTLLNPKRFIPHNVIQIHHITDDMVTDAPFFENIAEEFIEFLGTDTIFVAHNVEFDKDFINYELERAGYAKMNHQTLCTLKLSRRVFPDIRKYNLGSLSKTLGVNLSNAHRAFEDSLATAGVLLKIFEELEKNEKRTLKDINLKTIEISHTMSLF